MSRLHAVIAPMKEVARHFAAESAPIVTVPDETVEGTTGLVVFESRGRRLLRNMTWGFPRHTREMRERGDPPGVIGLVADLTNPLWEHLVADARYRCLIPITHFANPDGLDGAKTRTWFSVKDQPIMAWAGFCRNIPDVGPVYAGMTMTANTAVLPTNDRMPALLDPDEYDRWLNGSIKDVIGFQYRKPFSPQRMIRTETEDRWRSGKLPQAFFQPALL